MNSEKPLVSVICHCYNHEAFVIDTIKSVLNQNYDAIEIIIVDDFSADNSVRVIANFIAKYSEIKFIANSINLGITKSFNNALKLAKGKYIIDLAADDLLIPNCITKQVETFEKNSHKNLAIVYGNAELISENGEFTNYFFEVDSLKKVIQKRPTGYIYESIITSGKTYCSAAGMIKKTVYNALEGYDERLEYEDYDFWIRVSRDFEIEFIDEILIQKRVVQNSLETFFFKRNNIRSRKINYSTYLILKKAIKLNRTLSEDLAVKKRIHYEIMNCLRIADYKLFFKNIGLRMLLEYRMNFKKY